MNSAAKVCTRRQTVTWSTMTLGQQLLPVAIGEPEAPVPAHRDPRSPPEGTGTRPARQAGRLRLQGPDPRQRRRRHPRSHLEIGNPLDAPQLAPAIERITRRTGRAPRAVTADRGYGEASVERELHELGIRSVAIPRKAKPSATRRALESGR